MMRCREQPGCPIFFLLLGVSKQFPKQCEDNKKSIMYGERYILTAHTHRMIAFTPFSLGPVKWETIPVRAASALLRFAIYDLTIAVFAYTLVVVFGFFAFLGIPR